MQHNTAIISSNPSKSAASWSHGFKVLYWACIVRNTLISIALRRPARLHEIETELLSPDELYASFRAQACDPRLPDSDSQARGFIWTCKICKVLNSALSHIHRQMALENRNSIPDCSSVHGLNPDEPTDSTSFRIQSLYLTTLRESEEKLKRLYREYTEGLPETACQPILLTRHRNHTML